MSRPLRIVLAGEESAGVLAFRFLSRTQHVVVGVLTSDDSGSEVGSGLGPASRRAGIPVWPARWVKAPSFADRLRKEGVDLLLNVHSLHVIRPEVLGAPRIGSFNLHPGPLPEYAGLNCVSWAIYEGAPEYGVTLHWIEPDLDTGPIAFQRRFALGPDETPVSLGGLCAKEGVGLLVQLIETCEGDPAEVPRKEQDLSRRRYFGKKPPQQGRIDWKRSAAEVARFVRACDYLHFRSPWGRPVGSIGGREAEVLKASPTGRPAKVAPGTVGASGPQGLEVACADEWIAIQSVRFEGRTVRAAELRAVGQ